MTATTKNSLSLQMRDVLQGKIQGITVANGFDAEIALRSSDVIAGNRVSPSDHTSFPYVHLGNATSDYQGMHLPSRTDYPTITMTITAFVRDSRDCEALVDRLCVAICARIMDDYTLEGFSWNSFYQKFESFEEASMPGVGVSIIEWWAKAQHKIGTVNG